MILAEVLEEAVWNQVQVWLKDPERLAQEAVGHLVGQEDPDEQINIIDKHLEDINKGQNAVINLVANGLVDLNDSIKGRLSELKRRQERLENRKEELILLQKQHQDSMERIEELREISKAILNSLDELDFSEKVSLVRTLIKQVIVLGRGVQGGDGLRFIKVTIIAKIPEQAEGLAIVERREDSPIA